MAERAGRQNNAGYTGALRNTSLAQDIEWHYARPGDFAVRSGKHVVYIRAKPELIWNEKEGKWKPKKVLTIEASGPHHQVVEKEWGSEIGKYTPRRWVVP